MVEYALLLSLVALALVGTIGGMAGQVGSRFNAISNTLASGGNGGVGPGTTVPGDGSTGPTTSPSPSSPQTPPANTPPANTPDPTPSTPQETLPELGKTLDEYSWKELHQFAEDAAAKPTEATKYQYLIGMTKKTNVSGVGEVEMRLVGINEDTLADSSGKAGFTFISTTPKGFFKPNDFSGSSGTNVSFITTGQSNGELLYKFQYDCQRYIKKVKKAAVSSEMGSGAQMASLAVWMPSCREVAGAVKLSNGTDATNDNHPIYSYFNNNEYTNSGPYYRTAGYDSWSHSYRFVKSNGSANTGGWNTMIDGEVDYSIIQGNIPSLIGFCF